MNLNIILTIIIGTLLIPISRYQAVAQPCSRPNIIMIIGDDMRYDSFTITGGPSFLNTPSINRIAEEGARFDNFYCTYSLCVPARATLMTGLYAHNHGAVDNCSAFKKSMLTLPKLLDDNGYNTAMIGKYHVWAKWKYKTGWDYWFATKKTIEYVNPTMYWFLYEQQKTGNVEQIIYDTVEHYLAEIDTPFFLTIGHVAPHRPVTSLPQYDGIFDSEQMPVPANFYPFSKWYPSFLYEDSGKLYLDDEKLEKDYRDYFEGLMGIDRNVENIFDILTQRDLLDNTMILFLADNGALYGEHMLKGKGQSYDPSIHLPLFIRYPEWFTPNTVINGDFFGLNIDIMPTILDAACIDPDAYPLQGVSLRKLISGQAERDHFLLETIHLGDGNCDQEDDGLKPSLRAVRTKDYVYTWHQCDYVTEEFFDLADDPLETINLIHDPVYKTQINYARSALEELRIEFSDTLDTDTSHLDCYLLKAPPGSIDPEPVPDSLVIKFFPNPGAGNLKFSAVLPSDQPVVLKIYNALSEVFYEDLIYPDDEIISEDIDISFIPQGVYFVEIRNKDVLTVKTFLKE